MADDQFKAFLEAVEADAALQEKVQTEANRYADAVVAIAKEAGFGITADDVKRAQLEISEDDLEGVAGGTIPIKGLFNQITEFCTCGVENCDCMSCDSEATAG